MREFINRKPIIRKQIIPSQGQKASASEALIGDENVQNQNESDLEQPINETSTVNEKLEAINLYGYSERELKRKNVLVSRIRTDTISYQIDLILEKAASEGKWFLMLEINQALRKNLGLSNSQISGQVYAKLNQGFVENRDLNEEELAVFQEAGISPGHLKAWRVTDAFKERMQCIREQIEADAANESIASQDSATAVSDIKEGEPDGTISNDE